MPLVRTEGAFGALRQKYAKRVKEASKAFEKALGAWEKARAKHEEANAAAVAASKAAAVAYEAKLHAQNHVKANKKRFELQLAHAEKVLSDPKISSGLDTLGAQQFKLRKSVLAKAMEEAYERAVKFTGNANERAAEAAAALEEGHQLMVNTHEALKNAIQQVSNARTLR